MALIRRRRRGMVKKFFAGEEQVLRQRLNALMLLHYKQ
jgi:hypothetical protein